MENNTIVQAFEEELNLTEQGFNELIERKKGLVIDVKTDAGFKLARKERTEQNKTLDRIDRLAIDGKKSVDDARNVLKTRVAEIYAPTVTAFEAEDIRRKEEIARKKLEEENRIQAIREKINSIRQFSTTLIGASSEYLQGVIESVDLIDVSESFAELTQEAMIAKKETLAKLNQSLSSAIQNEQLEAERKDIRQERAKLESEKEDMAKHEEELQKYRPENCAREFAGDESLQPLPTAKKTGNDIVDNTTALNETLDGAESPVLSGLKNEAYEAHKKAEQKWHSYASELPVGDERKRAFEIYQNILTATRVA